MNEPVQPSPASESAQRDLRLLIRYFDSENTYEGNRGDLDHLSTAESAIRVMREQSARAEAAEAKLSQVDALLGGLEAMLEMLAKHARWCGYYGGAPGDDIVNRAPELARAALDAWKVQQHA